jgi:dihydroxyacetone kinase DhaKLM complex PTS-EIIA-like component DhaM
MKAVTKTTEAFPLNSVMSPGTYQINLETVTEMTGGKFDVENLVVYAVEGLCNLSVIVTSFSILTLNQ